MKGSSCSLQLLPVIYLTFAVSQLTAFYQVLQLCSCLLCYIFMLHNIAYVNDERHHQEVEVQDLQATMEEQVVGKEVEVYLW